MVSQRQFVAPILPPPIDLDREFADLKGLPALAASLPAARGRGRASASTLWRWIKEGCRRPDGRRVVLRAVRVGGRWCTTPQALRQILELLTAFAPVGSPDGERTRDEDVDARLDELLGGPR
jgi:hypothetical protein